MVFPRAFPPPRRSPAALGGALALLALAGTGPALGAADGPAPPTTPCRVRGIPNEVQCGHVQRPLDPARPGSPMLDVHFLVVPAVARHKRPDPVLMLAGGPGQSAITLAPSVLPLLSRLNQRRDLVFIDQRGTGRSAPLECEEPRDEPVAAQGDPKRLQALLGACRERLAGLAYVGGPQGLRHFTTTLGMQDVDAVRQALGVERWNVLGGSYGTRAALELQRQFPDTIRRTVLDGVAPPDMALPLSMSTDSQAALDATFAACEREAACHRAHPNLRADWARLLDGLPRSVTVTDPRSGRPDTFTLTRDMVLGAVRAPLYSPVLAAALPQAIAAAAQGRYEGLAGLSAVMTPRPGRPQSTSLATGMHFSVVCAEDVPRLAAATSTAGPGRDFGNQSRSMYEQVCADWPRGEVSPDFYRIPPARSAVLLLSGGLDPVTPPRHGERVAQALGAKASHRVVPNAGHGLFAVGCVRDVLYRFIEAEDDTAALAVDSSCVAAIPRPPAYLPPQPAGSSR